MVGRWGSFWEGLLAGAMLDWRREILNRLADINFVGDYVTYSCIGIITSQYKDPNGR